MRRAAAGLGLLVLLAASASPALGDASQLRELTVEEQRALTRALGASVDQPLSDDPTCLDDPSTPRVMTVAEALGDYLFRAVTDAETLSVALSCGMRADYPRGASEEYCQITFAPESQPPYGFIFRFDWQKKTIAEGSIECFK